LDFICKSAWTVEPSLNPRASNVGPFVYAACKALAPKLGVGPESLRRWVVLAQVDAGEKTGPSSDELEEIKRLRAEVRDLKESNEILKQASIFFARELDPRRR
jgi:transposase-like protein